MADSIRVAIITGANKGIGLSIVRQMCKQFKGHVYLTSRNIERGEEAVKLLKAEGLDPKFHQLDIDSISSIEELKKYCLDNYGGVDVLINNAGIMYSPDSTAPDIEQATVTIKINFTATLNMMRAFTPIVREHGRIVNISSSAGHLFRLNSQEKRDMFTNPALTEAELVGLMEEFVSDVREGELKERGWCNNFYSNSKLAVNALTLIYAREMAKSGEEDILINACCPGWVKTDMAGPKAPLTPEQGAETPVLLALLPVGSPSGKFWKDKKVAQW